MLNQTRKKNLYIIQLLWIGIVITAISFVIAQTNIVSQSSSSELIAVAWSPDRSKIAGGGMDGLLRIWDASTGAVLQDFPGIQWAVFSVAWSPDGMRIAGGGGDNIIRIWAVDGTPLASIDDHDANITSVAWNSDGSLLASSTHTGLDQFSLRIWDGNTYQPLVEDRTGDIGSIAWNPNLALSELAIAYQSRFLRVKTATATEIQTRASFENNAAMSSVAWNSNGSRLASGDATGKIDIWDPTNLTNVSTLTGHTDNVSALVWSPDDTRLASASSDGTIRVWDVETGQTANIFQNPKQSATTTIDWNDRGLIFGRGDGTVAIIEFPVANAGPDQTITDSDGSGSELVTLDGSASTDSDGMIVSYSWTENGIEIATGISPQVDLAVGTHTITLTVTDDDGATDTDDVVITVEAPSTACNATIPAIRHHIPHLRNHICQQRRFTADPLPEQQHLHTQRGR